MNERLKTLLTRAHLEHHPDSNAIATRFAELIVGECINEIRARKEIAIENSWNVDEAMSIVEADIEDLYDMDFNDENGPICPQN